jgi:hypothetical protein
MQALPYATTSELAGLPSSPFPTLEADQGILVPSDVTYPEKCTEAVGV